MKSLLDKLLEVSDKHKCFNCSYDDIDIPKQEIKSLFMELLGEDENPEEEYSHLHPDTRLNMPLREYRQSTDERNELKAELRKKIEDL